MSIEVDMINESVIKCSKDYEECTSCGAIIVNGKELRVVDFWLKDSRVSLPYCLTCKTPTVNG